MRTIFEPIFEMYISDANMWIKDMQLFHEVHVILGHLKWYIKQNKSNVNMKQCVVNMRDCASIYDM